MPWIPFLFLVIGSTAIDVLVALTTLLRPLAGREPGGPSTVGTRRLLAAALMTGVVFLVKLALLCRITMVNRFGIIHLVYADLIAVLPVAGIVSLIGARIRVGGKAWRPLTAPARLVALAGLGMIPIGLYATWIEPFRLRLERATVAIATNREGKDGVTIAVLTDLQTDRVSDYERHAVERLMALKPDIILMPGDVFQGMPEQFDQNREALRDLLSRLSAPGGVFLVIGDTDRGGKYLRQVLPSTSIRLLVDEVVRVTVRDRLVTIGGVRLDYTTGWARRTVEELETSAGDDDIRILLGHRPDVALGLRTDSRIDLVVAGHTHGGQIVIPGFGPPMTLTHVPRAVAAGGLHAIRGNPIYVSRGVGCERGQAPRIRFLCPPEISLLELVSGRGQREDRPPFMAGHPADRSGRPAAPR